ncbi:hypothetical protein K505DRAFT_321825 [Melanomma pulvis-pyrius CBS 109.77]|uniref:DUF1349-domain-containing protein n=1 Tax=Melanomma pulvis-pyrius CBS 109.77 TaxID=1314802 RepID=A0A6A6XPV4_9PLEO|nr:hypothetical protein K505DRAFT_321825 [Melanomma pulvis-pyrius CBS 109.77]
MSLATKTVTVPPFNLSSPAGTDIWRKPPSHNVNDAPTHPNPLPQYKLTDFQSAKVTFSLPVANTLLQYDQAGLLLHFTKPGLAPGKDKWIKTGVEFYYGAPYISTVGCETYADWSIVPLTPFAGNDSRPTTTIELRREKDVLGKSLWAYQLLYDGEGKEVERRSLRELTWVFADEEGWNVGIGGYVARPNTDGDGVLEAEFGKGVDVVILDEAK